MQIIKSSEKKKILNQLNEQFGIEKIPYLLIRFGKERIRAYSGSLSMNELMVLDRNLRIESAGLYLCKHQPEGIRLAFDSMQIFKSQINKNILELNDKEAYDWLRGNDLQIKAEKSFKILKNKNELIGCGKSTGEKITNFIPKERRIN